MRQSRYTKQQSEADGLHGEIQARTGAAGGSRATQDSAIEQPEPTDIGMSVQRRGLFAAIAALVGTGLGFWARTAQAGHAGGNIFHIGTGSASSNITKDHTALRRDPPEKLKNSWALGVDNTSPSGYGIRGDVNSSGVGVLGNNLSFNKGGIGVWGQCSSGIGVLGANEPDEGGGYGVVGKSPDVGVQGEGDSAGVVGKSERNGVEGWGEKNCGVIGESPTIAVCGITSNTATGFAGYFLGDVYIKGDLNVQGLKSAAVAFADGSLRRLYSVESPESWFEDFGEARLEYGQAEVPIDPDFAAVTAPPYHIFITPYGESRGLYVARRAKQLFVVREQGAGTSTVTFGYRIVGKRGDIASTRFARVAEPKLSVDPAVARWVPPLPASPPAAK